MSRIPVAPPILSLCSCAVWVLAGCSLQSTSPAIPDAGVAFKGSVHGGQQPVAGASVYLYAVNTTGYGGNGIAASSSNASISLLNNSVLTENPGRSGIDSNGNYYVTTGSSGGFNVAGDDFSCTSGQQLYMYAVGGNPGAGTNSAVGILAALGGCPGITSNTFIAMNEVSTIDAGYALAGFASDATHISSSGTPLAQTGVANAMLNAANLATLGTGAALATTPAGNGAVPQSKINSLANTLATCVNSTGPSSTGCSALLSSATSNGTSTGVQPTDTATAAIYIAQNPSANVETLYGMPPPASPFAPTLAAQPHDWTMAIHFSNNNNNSNLQLYGVAIDALGNVWTSNYLSLLEFSSTGAALSGPNGYTGGGVYSPSIAIDAFGNVWTANASSSVSEFNSSGVAISGQNGYYGGGLSSPDAIAIDALGNIWVANGGANSLSEFNSSGMAVSSSSGYTGGGLDGPSGIAIDASGNVWATNAKNNSFSEFYSSGAPITGSNGFDDGGLDDPVGIAIDAFGDVWAVNRQDSSLSMVLPSGEPIPGHPPPSVTVCIPPLPLRWTAPVTSGWRMTIHATRSASSALPVAPSPTITAITATTPIRPRPSPLTARATSGPRIRTAWTSTSAPPRP